MKFLYASISAMLIYTTGDTIAALIQNEFSLIRFTGMMLLAGTVYTLEIPTYFHWIDKVVPAEKNLSSTFKRALLAMAFFNPLWVARHLAFIALCKGDWQAIDWGLLNIACVSFVFNVPLSLIVNYVIQNRLAFKWRYLASSLFSAVLAVYYAMSDMLFGSFNVMAMFTF